MKRILNIYQAAQRAELVFHSTFCVEDTPKARRFLITHKRHLIAFRHKGVRLLDISMSFDEFHENRQAGRVANAKAA